MLPNIIFYIQNNVEYKYLIAHFTSLNDFFNSYFASYKLDNMLLFFSGLFSPATGNTWLFFWDFSVSYPKLCIFEVNLLFEVITGTGKGICYF